MQLIKSLFYPDPVRCPNHGPLGFPALRAGRPEKIWSAEREDPVRNYLGKARSRRKLGLPFSWLSSSYKLLFYSISRVFF